MLATCNVLSGVIHGSLMGRLLFLIYIDGISAIPLVHESNGVIYVDDICLYKQIYTSSNLRLVQDDIKAIEQ